MSGFRKTSLSLAVLAACAIPALANVTVNTPTNGDDVLPQFALSAEATTCSNQAVTAMGFSLDSSSNTTIVKATSIDAAVTAPTGTHTLHVKAWGNQGAACDTDVAITVGETINGVSVSTPGNGATVFSPFILTADALACSSQPVAAMGYSIDNGSTAIFDATSIDATVTAAPGAHTLHVKAWGNQGAPCDTDVALTVSDSPPSLPSSAISVSSIQSLSNWVAAHDPAAGTSSSGTMSMASSPSLSGNARQFNTSFSGSGGEIYHVTFGDDTSATNFLYDGWVYLTSSASSIANLELDMNQVMANGQTVIYGFQCDGYSGTWDYTENAGTPTSPSDQWVHSSAACNARNGAQNTWHHVQVWYSRDDSGNVTYHSVWLDGVESPINATVPSSFALGWAPMLLTNFQIDGLGTGSNTVYLDDLTISRW